MDREIVKQKLEAKTKSKTRTGKQKCKLILVFFGIILSLIVIIIAYYFYRNNNRVNEYTQRLQQQINENQQQIVILQAQLQQLTGQQRQLMMQLQKQGFSDEDWLLVKAVYLLQQAQWGLELHDDIPTIIATLKMIASRVDQVNSYRLSQLATALANDIKTLQALKLTDMQTLQQQFSQLSQAIDTLTLHQDYASKQNKVSEQHSGWRKALHNSWSVLREMVVVQHTDSALTPLSQQQLLSFKQYLQSLAQQAFWSALHNNAAVYHQSLRQMQQALQQYLLPTDRQLPLLQRQLAQLQKEKFAVLLPHTLSSLIVARQLQMKTIAPAQGREK